MAAVHAPTWGLLFVLFFMTIESSFIPFPSEVVMVPAGFLAARGAMLLGSPWPDAVLAIVAGTFGSLLGAYLNYALAQRLGAPFLARYGGFLLLPPQKLERAEALFRRYGAGATFVCRLLPSIRQLISIPAGLARMPLRKLHVLDRAGRRALGAPTGDYCGLREPMARSRSTRFRTRASISSRSWRSCSTDMPAGSGRFQSS